MDRSRFSSVFLLLLLVFLGLWCRLAFLQVARSGAMSAAAVAARSLSLPLANFLRGDIKDRWGRSLLDTREGYRVAVFPSLLP